LKEKKKTSRLKKLLRWLIIDITVAVILIVLLFHTPSGYNPISPSGDGDGDEAVHPYLSHELAPQFYNEAQDQEPFEIVVLDASLNEAIGQMSWPQEHDGATFSAPEILFVPGRVILMGTATVQDVDLVITVHLEPRWDDERYLGIDVQKFKVGAMNLTPVAKILGKRQYQQRLETVPVDTSTIGAKVVAALLNEESFDPIFEVEDKWVRLVGVEIDRGKLTARFVPAENPRNMTP